ncbi:hypothetical protein BC830DRAFT_1165765 [Chytriomyces sp. MP71]|nr:hypothetical protein BC830DRAFT_1165765 [Chytriomyces sp. MP71]
MSRQPRTYKGKPTKATEAFTNMPDIRDMFSSARFRSVSGPSTFTSSNAGLHPPTRPLLKAIGTVKPSQIRRHSVSVSNSVATPAVSSSQSVNAPPANRCRLIDDDKEEDEQNTPNADTLQLDNEDVSGPPIVPYRPETLPGSVESNSDDDSVVDADLNPDLSHIWIPFNLTADPKETQYPF